MCFYLRHVRCEFRCEQYASRGAFHLHVMCRNRAATLRNDAGIHRVFQTNDSVLESVCYSRSTPRTLYFKVETIEFRAAIRASVESLSIIFALFSPPQPLHALNPRIPSSVQLPLFCFSLCKYVHPQV